jgi:hypothetical protein
MSDRKTEAIDWRLTTFEGSRREQLRRWAELPLERMIMALEEMEEIAKKLSGRKAQRNHAQKS